MQKICIWGRWAAYTLLAIGLLLLLQIGISAWRITSKTPAAAGAGGTAVPPTTATSYWSRFDVAIWDVFKSGTPPAAPSTGILSQRYRLAGVFLVLTGSADADQRCAILDDLTTKQQHLLQENEWSGGIQVLRVTEQSVVVTDGQNEETIFLAAGTLDTAASTGRKLPTDPNAPAILETTRFGNRVGDTRWEMSKDALLDYAQEVMDQPERLSSLYISMEPDYDDARKIDGYRLNMVGENDFWRDVGLQQGDIVRKVNSMRMTSQRRAEYFIGEFMQNNLGAVVLDIERNGQPEKLIYLIR